jgi:hypothetical protein
VTSVLNNDARDQMFATHLVWELPVSQLQWSSDRNTWQASAFLEGKRNINDEQIAKVSILDQ